MKGNDNLVRPGTPREPDLASFGFLWAFALLAHQAGYGVVRASLLDSALTLAALAAMLLPAVPILALLAALHVATVLHHLPDVFNHWYFAGLVSLSLLLGCGAAGWRARMRGEPAGKGLADGFAPAARWSLLLLYFLTGFHKLNQDFFDPAVSCGPVLFDQLSARLGGIPDLPAMDSLIIGGTVAVELGLPVLLLIPRLRRIGIAIGVLFHVAMALAGYWRFSAAGLALLTLFLPRGFLPVPPGLRALAVLALLPAVALASRGWGALLFWAAMALAGALLWLTVTRRGREAGIIAPVPRGRLRLAMAGTLLVVLSGLAPYLGLGTDRAFSMYSNVRTEGGRSNHFVMPAGLQVFPYQRDLVQVLGSNAPRLERLAGGGWEIPYDELRARLTEEIAVSDSAVSVRFIRGAARREVASAASDSLLRLPVPGWRLKLLRWRPVEAGGPRRCGV